MTVYLYSRVENCLSIIFVKCHFKGALALLLYNALLLPNFVISAANRTCSTEGKSQSAVPYIQQCPILYYIPVHIISFCFSEMNNSLLQLDFALMCNNKQLTANNKQLVRHLLRIQALWALIPPQKVKPLQYQQKVL